MENLLPDGDFKAEITLSGGTGRTTIQSPADVHIENGIITAEIIWSSPNYDYMEVDGVGYTPVSIEGGAAFSVVIPALDEEIPIKAETVAMSSPHMIEYTLLVSGAEIRLPEETSSEISDGISADSDMTSTVSDVVIGTRTYFDMPIIAATVGGAFVAAVIAAVIVQLVKRKKK